MQRCIQLAENAFGQTYPNPMVGSVIVFNDEIIGEGFHEKGGEPHAEINAVNSVRNPELLRESTIYVSLEPCSHYGKTPPCAEKLAAVGFKKVVIGTLDPHEKVNGKGRKIIKDAGIEVVSGILEKECQQLNRRFFTFHQKRRPYIILKWAEAGDGFLDRDFKPTQIGNPLTKQFVHTLRSREHAILVGTTTAMTDNPSLTTREIEGRNPIRILIDFDLKVPRNFKIFNQDGQTIIFNGIKDADDGNLRYIKIRKERMITLLLDKLYELQIQSVIIEGGKVTLQQFLDENLWDEAVVIKNEKLQFENGTKAPVIDSAIVATEVFGDNLIDFYKNSIF